MTPSSSIPKIIWFAGIPSSGKTTMGMRLWLELDWAGKRSAMLDDEQLKYVDSGEKTQKIIDNMGAEYVIVITPFFKHLPRRPDLIVWCKAPMIECAERDMAKAHGGETLEQIQKGFTQYWGSYFIDADLILNTYDGTRKTKETVELCWKILKEKVESIFGDFGWHNYTDGEPAWDSAEPRFQFSSWNRKRIGGWFWRWNRDGANTTKRNKGIKTEGITISPPEAKFGRRRGLNVKVVDMHQIKYKPRYFDLVFSKDCFKQAMSPVIAWGEFTRVARKYIMISEPDNRWEQRAHNHLLLTKRQFQVLAEKFGFKLIKFWTLDQGYVKQRNFLFERVF